MASESDSQEKTEDPTPKRIEQAMEDGQVLSSKELFVFTTLFAGLFVYFVAVNSSGFLLGQWKGFFQFDLDEFNGELVRLSYGAFLYIITLRARHWGADDHSCLVYPRHFVRSDQFCSQSNEFQRVSH